MSVVGDFRIPAGSFALEHALSATPGTRIEADRMASHSPEEVIPFLWARVPPHGREASTDVGYRMHVQNSENEAVRPDSFGRCIECRSIYAVYESNAGALHPAGTDGGSSAGTTPFGRYPGNWSQPSLRRLVPIVTIPFRGLPVEEHHRSSSNGRACRRKR
jgi:hypothetical protein